MHTFCLAHTVLKMVKSCRLQRWCWWNLTDFIYTQRCKASACKALWVSVHGDWTSLLLLMKFSRRALRFTMPCPWRCGCMCPQQFMNARSSLPHWCTTLANLNASNINLGCWHTIVITTIAYCCDYHMYLAAVITVNKFHSNVTVADMTVRLLEVDHCTHTI